MSGVAAFYMGLPIYESRLVREGEVIVAPDHNRAYAAALTLWRLRHPGQWPMLSRHCRGLRELGRDRRRYPRSPHTVNAA